MLSVWVPTIHPFDAAGRLDEPAFRRHLARLVTVGASIYVANEGTGESRTFAADEMRRVLAVANDEVAGRVRVHGMGKGVYGIRHALAQASLLDREVHADDVEP
jgi:4-hydroxy-tetrahydrodipicolinate synthase